MADFPNNPNIGDTFDLNSVVWTWDGNQWIAKDNPDGLLLGSQIVLGPAQIVTANIANESITTDKIAGGGGGLFGSTGPTGPTGPNGNFYTSATAPTGPNYGDGWFNTEEAKAYIYYDGYWVQI